MSANSIAMFYYNYAKNMFEARRSAPEDWSDYIPRIPSALNLYRVYVELGDSSAQAARKVLTIFAEAHNERI